MISATRARICKLFNERRNRFPAWRAGTKTLFDVPAPPGYKRWRNRFLERFLRIDSLESIPGLLKRLQIMAQTVKYPFFCGRVGGRRKFYFKHADFYAKNSCKQRARTYNRVSFCAVVFDFQVVQTIHKVLTYVEYRNVSGVFQNIDPSPPSPPSECVLPPHQRRGIQTRRAVRGVGGQYFGRRQTLDWPLTV